NRAARVNWPRWSKASPRVRPGPTFSPGRGPAATFSEKSMLIFDFRPASHRKTNCRMTPHEATEQGLAAHKAGRLDAAQTLYQTALKAAADFHPALHLMGLLHVQ